ncbi:MAG TPA: GGDEF domain-containing response regulator [Gammaproteobacteria bacterium]|nr:GGDEF domain-containing response regulator [Gammaproteobacteria bacterium]
MPQQANTPEGNTGQRAKRAGLLGSSAAKFESLQQMRVLVVDDIDDNVDLLKSLLRRSGFTNLVTAHSGKEALVLLQECRSEGLSAVDAVLTDIMMPGMSGHELCRIIRATEEWEDIPVIMITANSAWQEEVVRHSYEAGATDIMFKPVRKVDLVPRVISALALKQERDLRKNKERQLEAELAERRIMEARLQHLVGHDDLTGLCNRRRLEQQLEVAVFRARKQQQHSALLYIDLDQFKLINDSEGHITGDRLLVDVGNLLRRQCSPRGLVARISADEFAVLYMDISEHDALETADALRKSMDTFRFVTDNRHYHIGASIGVSVVRPGDICSGSEILARADEACFVAKTNGRNMVHLFSAEDQAMATLRNAIQWVPRIREALANNKFKLVFQPVLDLRTNTVSRYETLIRMTADDGSLISPGQFIPVAEHMGLIHDIDSWVVSSSIDVLSKTDRSSPPLGLNINLSGHAFQDRKLLPLVKRKLEETGVDGGRITFEITETAAMSNLSQTRDMITRLRQLGCRFALDDFGSGFSSFSYLKEFPVDDLKIDGSFITNLINDPVDQTLVKSIIAIARTLNKRVVAEFVENAEVLRVLKDYGADYAQGYFIGRPSDTLLPAQ